MLIPLKNCHEENSSVCVSEEGDRGFSVLFSPCERTASSCLCDRRRLWGSAPRCLGQACVLPTGTDRSPAWCQALSCLRISGGDAVCLQLSTIQPLQCILCVKCSKKKQKAEPTSDTTTESVSGRGDGYREMLLQL